MMISTMSVLSNPHLIGGCHVASDGVRNAHLPTGHKPVSQVLNSHCELRKEALEREPRPWPSRKVSTSPFKPIELHMLRSRDKCIGGWLGQTKSLITSHEAMEPA